MKKPKRILVIGCSGNGKSTLTGALSSYYSLPAIYLDTEFWLPNWTEPNKLKWAEKVNDLASQDEWVMDGTFSSTLKPRAERADQIIYLNLNRYQCLYRVLKRRIKYNKKTRPDMAEGCFEKIDLDFYKYIWTFNKTYKEKIFEIIQQANMLDRTTILSSQKEIDQYLKNLA